MPLSDDVRAAIKAAKVYDLSHQLDASTPIHPSHSPYRISLLRRYGDMVRPGGLSGATEMIVMSGHSSTHMDALGHMSVEGELHGGADAHAAAQGGWGLQSHHIAEVAPVISDGVLIDAAGVRGRAYEAGEEVTVADLRAALEVSDARIGDGDTVLVRTGWHRMWDEPEAYAGLPAGSPGVGLDGARWLVEQGARLLGSDTMVFEHVPEGVHALPVHGFLLVEQGINIMEMVNLDELAGDGISRFLFVASPLRIVGATGSPLRPLALV